MLVLDGGLATELERRGHDLDHALWSARLLIDAPDAIERVHYDFFAAGAQCVTTASYQASHRGFADAGLGGDAATALLRKSVLLATSARTRFIADDLAAREGRPLFVAASIGPYGATLHDGSEYRGDYDLSEDALAKFHAERIAVLTDAGADILACETIPLLREARAIARALTEAPAAVAWVSFTSADGARTPGGDALADCAAALDNNAHVLAIGVNCVSPDIVALCLRELRKGTGKPLVVYPNVAGRWDAAARRFTDPRAFDAVLDRVPEWLALGARAVGGCCGTTPDDIRRLVTAVGSGGRERRP